MSQAVVQAAREVQQVQNRFRNLGGKFVEGLQIVEAKNQKRREEKEKRVQDALNRARKNARELDNNINTLGYSEAESQIIKDMSLEKTEKFYELQGQLSLFDNPRSPEAQELVNEMNGIRNWFTNVEKQQKQRLIQRTQYNSDLGDEDSSGISVASQNQTFAANAETINLGSFSAIDPVTGEFLWGEEGNYMRLAAGSEYIMNPGKLFALIDKHEAMATSKTQPLTSGQVNLAVKRFKKLIDNKNALASLLASDNPIAEAYGPDLQSRFDKAYEADDQDALDAIIEEIAAGYETRLREINNDHIAEIKANQNPNPPNTGATIRPELQGAYKQMEDLQNEIMSRPIAPGVEEPAELTTGAKTWSVGPKDNPSKIRVKLDPQLRKWVYFDASNNIRAEYDSIEELTKAYPSLFFK